MLAKTLNSTISTLGYVSMPKVWTHMKATQSCDEELCLVSNRMWSLEAYPPSTQARLDTRNVLETTSFKEHLPYETDLITAQGGLYTSFWQYSSDQESIPECI